MTCPCDVDCFDDGVVVIKTARNDTYIYRPNHPGKGLTCNGKYDPSVRFGPKIPFPDETPEEQA